jgi:hypothetical protein
MKFHLHKYKDVIEYNEMAMKGSEIPFIAYEKCILCDKKRKFVQGWIDISEALKKKEKENERGK